MDEQVGNFFTEFGDAEGRTNFALWSLMKSPLLLGTDLTNMSAATLATITNKAAIAVNKDGLAEQGLLRTNTWQPGNKHSPSSAHGYQVWSGALSKGGAAAVLANLETTPQAITLDSGELPEHRQAEAGSGAGQWSIAEAFTGKVHCSSCALPQTATVGPHDVAMWVLSPAGQ